MKSRALRLTIFLLPLFLYAPLSAQNLTARAVADEAAKQADADASLAYIQAQLPNVSAPAEKRALYAFLASLQEQLLKFDDARASYAAAAGISAGDAAGMPKKSGEQLVLDAVRCALSAGDWATADSYLNSAVRNSKDERIQAYIKLYALWSELCRANVSSDLDESVVMLQAYSSLPSMSAVKPAVLLTLWYITGEKNYADSLKSEFPNSLEAGIVTGKVQMLPAPFWYFLPRREGSAPEIADIGVPLGDATTAPDSQSAGGAGNNGTGNAQSGTSAANSTNANAASANTTTTENSAAPQKLQLGLFREKANADRLVATLKEKGFSAYITTETRASGTTYYIVLVDESRASLGDELRTAGFEFYPL